MKVPSWANFLWMEFSERKWKAEETIVYVIGTPTFSPMHALLLDLILYLWKSMFLCLCYFLFNKVRTSSQREEVL